MITTMAAVVRASGGPFTLEPVELDDVRADEVLVRMVATGVCHTDINVATGATPFPLPGVLGHEGAGVVEEVGSRVTRARPGDRVLLTYTSCGRCRWCREGHPAYCEHHLRLNLLGGRRADGSATVRHRGDALNAHFFGQSSFARHSIADERSLIVLPEHTDERDLPLIAPLGCGIQTGAGAVLNVLRPRPGDVGAVTGAGAVGLAAVMAARLTPAGQVIAVDRVPARLELARELGATDVIDTSVRDLREALLDATAGKGVDFAVETTGNTGILETLIAATAVRGHCAVIAAPRAGARASFDVKAMLPGRTVLGVTLGDGEPEGFVPMLAAAYERGRFPLDRLQRTYPFEEINRAIADAESGATVKPVLLF